MARYVAEMLHGNRPAEGEYHFEAEDDLLTHSPMTVLRTFLQWVVDHSALDHIDYEVNAAMKNEEHGVVTALGTLHFDKDGKQPFTAMISRAPD